MSKNSSYKNIKDLISSLEKRTNQLESGNLNSEELGKMLEDARNLYERVTVLQYLAFEKDVKGEEKPVKKAAPKPKVEEPKVTQGSFMLNFGSPEEEVEEEAVEEQLEDEALKNQTNLLDAIEEEVESQAMEQEVEEVVEETPKMEEVIEEPKPEVIQQAPEVKEEVKETVAEEQSQSINDKFATNTEKPTLAERLSKKPIEDLTKAIAVNQKFLFMNDLFEGENTLYKEALETLNNFMSFSEASEYMFNELRTRFDWDMESKSVQTFASLVERRYL